MFKITFNNIKHNPPNNLYQYNLQLHINFRPQLPNHNLHPTKQTQSNSKQTIHRQKHNPHTLPHNNLNTPSTYKQTIQNQHITLIKHKYKHIYNIKTKQNTTQHTLIHHRHINTIQTKRNNQRFTLKTHIRNISSICSDFSPQS